MLMRTDPFRELDRITQQVLGTPARPAMPLDARSEVGDTTTEDRDPVAV